MKWEKPGYEYDKIGNQFKGKRLILFDVSEESYEFCNKVYAIKPELIAAAVIDEGKSVKKICDAPTITKQEFSAMNVDEYIVVLCCSHISNYRAQAHKQATNLGYIDGINLFYYDVFLYYYLPIYLLYTSDILYFKSTCMVITTTCNLNCKCCLNYTSYNKKQRHYPLKELKNNVDLYFANIDKVDRFMISGGETLLYPHIVELLDYIHNNYSDRILNFTVVTNGTIIPSPSIMECLKRNRIRVELDDYRRTLGERSKVEEISNFFEEKGINYELIKVPYWIDMDPVEGNKKCNLEEKANTCNVPFSCILSGRLFTCIFNSFAMEAGIISREEADMDSIDLQNIENRYILLEAQLGYSRRGFYTFCSKCPGHEWMNKHDVLPAQQL